MDFLIHFKNIFITYKYVNKNNRFVGENVKRPKACILYHEKQFLSNSIG